MAGGTIGSLAVNLVLDTKKFSAGARAARTSLEKLSDSFLSLKNVAIATGTALTTGVIARGFLETAQQMDAIGDKAEQIGMSAESLSGLGHAAQIAGASLESMSAGLERMMRSEAAIVKLGFDVNRIRQLKPDELFIEIAEAIRKMPSRLEQGAAAMAIFGRRGSELIPLLNSGAEGIKKLTDEAKGLGLTFGDEAAAKAGEVTDAFDRMAAAIRGVKQELTVLASGPVVDGLNKLIATMKGMKDVHDVLGKGDAPTNMAAAFKPLVDSMNDETFRKFRRAFGQGNESALVEFMGLESTGGSAYGALRNRAILDAVQKRTDRDVEKRRSQVEEGMKNLLTVAMTAALGPSPLSPTAAVDVPLSLAEIHRIQAAAGGLVPHGRAESVLSRRASDFEFRGLPALEKGSAAAFSQERRSAQQNQMMKLQQDQLKEDKQQTKALQSIDANMRNAVVLEAANFAA